MGEIPWKVNGSGKLSKANQAQETSTLCSHRWPARCPVYAGEVVEKLLVIAQIRDCRSTASVAAMTKNIAAHTKSRKRGGLLANE